MEQNEIDNLMKDFQPPPADAGAPPVKEDIGWDDVKEELNQSKGETPKTEVSEVAFGEIKKAEPVKGAVLDLDFILDIPLTLTAELGRNRMLISELLQLGQGSVIELSKLAGEPMDIFVNQRLIARGEVVVVNEKFGVRLTDIVSPTERINRLR
ncbi:MAG: Flagellar motor switch protein FliN [Syntrophaceae bacterium PtaU1.Bin231]|jgi:flagellar motor switch protein FliN/FliY|nr:MAG: Flagellar motor switch protein FliN [Syntrophaceae bacterium PtaU1.Bin231]HOG16753.1 flagellar motor switch protein FliN [Syntrophales bacterium]